MTTIDLKDAGAYIDRVSKEWHAKAILGCRLAAVRGLQTIVTVIIPSREPMPVDRGIYRAGWKIRSIPEGAELYNDSPIAAIIEFGVRAKNVKIGRAMIEALTEWVLRKGLASDQDEAVGIAWAIAKNAKAGKGFHNQRPGGGLRILTEFVSVYLRDYVHDAVMRELSR